MRVRTILKTVSVAAKQIVGVDTALEDRNGAVVFTARQCPYCSGVHASSAFCLTAVGALDEVAHWATGERWVTAETACRANGAPACVFEVRPTNHQGA
jgi:predicted hydrocarbon binding protein